MPPAARVNDQTAHGQALMPGIGSTNVLIRFQPAWRALPAGVAASVESVSGAIADFMQKSSLNPEAAKGDIAKINKGLAEAAGQAVAAGNPAAAGVAAGAAAGLNLAETGLNTTWKSASTAPGGQPAADKAYTDGIKAAMAVAASSVFSSIAGPTDMHLCPLPCPLPPHGPGVVTQGSKSVFINNLPATRMGDRVFEACGGEDPIAAGEPTVIIGDQPGVGSTSSGTAATSDADPSSTSADEELRRAVVQAMTTSEPATVSKVSPDLVGPLQPERDEPAQPTWIGILLTDFDGSPVPNEDLVVTLDDGQVLPGKTDDKGHVRFDGVQPSRGQVAFVEIPDEAELQSNPASRLATIKGDEPTANYAPLRAARKAASREQAAPEELTNDYDREILSGMWADIPDEGLFA